MIHTFGQPSRVSLPPATDDFADTKQNVASNATDGAGKSGDSVNAHGTVVQDVRVSPCGKYVCVLQPWSLHIFSNGQFRVLLASHFRPVYTQAYGYHTVCCWDWDSSRVLVAAAPEPSVCVFSIGLVYGSAVQRKSPFHGGAWNSPFDRVSLTNMKHTPNNSQQPIGMKSWENWDAGDTDDESSSASEDYVEVTPHAAENSTSPYEAIRSIPSLMLQYRPRSTIPIDVSFQVLLSLPVRPASLCASPTHVLIGCARQPAILFMPHESLGVVQAVLYLSDLRRQTWRVSQWKSALHQEMRSGGTVLYVENVDSEVVDRRGITNLSSMITEQAKERLSEKTSEEVVYLYAPQNCCTLVELIHFECNTRAVTLLPDLPEEVAVCPPVCKTEAVGTGTNRMRHHSGMRSNSENIRSAHDHSRWSQVGAVLGASDSDESPRSRRVEGNLCVTGGLEICGTAEYAAASDGCSSTRAMPRSATYEIVRAANKGMQEAVGIRDLQLCGRLDIVAALTTQGELMLLAWRYPLRGVSGSFHGNHLVRETEESRKCEEASGVNILPIGGHIILTKERRRPLGILLKSFGVTACALSDERHSVAVGLASGCVEIYQLHWSPHPTVPSDDGVNRRTARDTASDVRNEEADGFTLIPRLVAVVGRPEKAGASSKSDHHTLPICNDTEPPFRRDGCVECLSWVDDGLALGVKWRCGGAAVFSHLGRPLFTVDEPQVRAVHIPRCKISIPPARSTRSVHTVLPGLGARHLCCWVGAGLGMLLAFDPPQQAIVETDAAVFDEHTQNDKRADGRLLEIPVYRNATIGVGTSAIDCAGNRCNCDASERILIGASQLLYWQSPPFLPSSACWTQIPLPPAMYISRNWPIRQACLSPSQSQLLVSGTYGIALYSMVQRKWRTLCTAKQEKLLPTGLLPTGWYTDDIFYVCSRTWNLHAAAAAAAAAAPEPFSSVCRDGSVPWWSGSTTKLESASASLDCAIRNCPVRFNGYVPFSVHERTAWMGTTSSGGFGGYSLVFLRQSLRLDLTLHVAVVRCLPARPLRSFCIPSPSRRAHHTSPDEGWCCMCGNVSLIEAGRNNTKCPVCMGMVERAIKRLGSGVSEFPILAVYDALFTVTAYQLQKPPSALSTGRAQVFDVVALWQLNLSECCREHPLQLHFIGCSWLLLVLHADGRLMVCRINWPCPVNRGGEHRALQKGISKHRILQLRVDRMICIATDISSVWMGPSSQLESFYPVPFSDLHILEATSSGSDDEPENQVCRCVCRGTLNISKSDVRNNGAIRYNKAITCESRKNCGELHLGSAPYPHVKDCGRVISRASTERACLSNGFVGCLDDAGSSPVGRNRRFSEVNAPITITGDSFGGVQMIRKYSDSASDYCRATRISPVVARDPYCSHRCSQDTVMKDRMLASNGARLSQHRNVCRGRSVTSRIEDCSYLDDRNVDEAGVNQCRSTAQPLNLYVQAYAPRTLPCFKNGRAGHHARSDTSVGTKLGRGVENAYTKPHRREPPLTSLGRESMHYQSRPFYSGASVLDSVQDCSLSGVPSVTEGDFIAGTSALNPGGSSTARRSQIAPDFSSEKGRDCGFDVHDIGEDARHPLRACASLSNAELEGCDFCCSCVGGWMIWSQNDAGLLLTTVGFHYSPHHTAVSDSGLSRKNLSGAKFGEGVLSEDDHLCDAAIVNDVAVRIRTSLILPIEQLPEPVQAMGIFAKLGIAVACSPSRVTSFGFPTHAAPISELRLQLQPCLHALLHRLLVATSIWRYTFMLKDGSNTIRNSNWIDSDRVAGDVIFNEYDCATSRCKNERVSYLEKLDGTDWNYRRWTTGIVAVEGLVRELQKSPFFSHLLELCHYGLLMRCINTYLRTGKAAAKQLRMKSPSINTLRSTVEECERIDGIPTGARRQGSLNDATTAVMRSCEGRSLHFLLGFLRTHFPRCFTRTVAACMRKTEPLLAPAVLEPLVEGGAVELYLQCLRSSLLHTASLYLLPIQNVEGPLRVRILRVLPLLESAMNQSLYGLARKVLHFFFAFYSYRPDRRVQRSGGRGIGYDGFTSSTLWQRGLSSGHNVGDNAPCELSLLWHPLLAVCQDRKQPRCMIEAYMKGGVTEIMTQSRFLSEKAGFEAPTLFELAEKLVPYEFDPADRLAASRAYIAAETVVACSILKCVRGFQWLRLFHLATTLAIDLAAWLSPFAFELTLEFDSSRCGAQVVQTEAGVGSKRSPVPATSVAEASCDEYSKEVWPRVNGTDYLGCLYSFQFAVLSMKMQLITNDVPVLLCLERRLLHRATLKKLPIDEAMVKLGCVLQQRSYALMHEPPHIRSIVEAKDVHLRTLKKECSVRASLPVDLELSCSGPLLLDNGLTRRCASEILRYYANVFVAARMPLHALAVVSAAEDQIAAALLMFCFPNIRIAISTQSHDYANQHTKANNCTGDPWSSASSLWNWLAVVQNAAVDVEHQLRWP